MFHHKYAGDYDVMPAPDSIQLSQGEKGKISKLDQQGEEVNHDSTGKNVSKIKISYDFTF